MKGVFALRAYQPFAWRVYRMGRPLAHSERRGVVLARVRRPHRIRTPTWHGSRIGGSCGSASGPTSRIVRRTGFQLGW